MGRPRIGIVSGILNPRYGGPPVVVRGHVRGLGSRAEVKVFGVQDPGDEAELRGLYPGCELFPRAFPKRWFRGQGLRRALVEQAPGLDLLHAHMLWDHTVWATAYAARRAKVPFIVSPHGNILNVEPWWPPHKVAYREIVLKPLLKNCAFVHALSEREAEGCRRFGVVCPIRVIPNGLPLSDYSLRRDPDLALETWPALKGRRVLLFIGRLAPLKGLDMLLNAWSRCLRDPSLRDWILVIAGHDYRGYAHQVALQVKALGLEGSVILPGPVLGALKQSLLGHAEAFTLPSRTEGFSVALLEALSASLPCVYTTECHFSELAKKGGGWEVQPNAGDLSEALELALRQTPERLRSMGAAGNALGRSKYSLERVADQLLDMYRTAMGRRGLPPARAFAVQLQSKKRAAPRHSGVQGLARMFMGGTK
jgi:glycosyltransferase involved in cell wall biosynthesis